MHLDVLRIRDDFPALRERVAHFDGPGGSQVPRQVAEAMAAVMCSGISNRGSVTAAERRAEQVVQEARQAMADLLGCEPRGVVFTRSATQAAYDVSRALARQWTAGDEVVVTRLDHDANIRPWIQAAESAGAAVRWAAFDPGSGELSVDALREQLSGRTRLVAVTGASNLLGTRPDVAAIAAAVHEVGALLYVDGVHLTPHAPVDLATLGADFFSCSPYKFFGPHHGAVVADPGLWEELRPHKLLPSSDAVPERFELGTLPYEMLAGTTAAVDYIASLASSAGDRRSRVLESMRAVEAYEQKLLRRLLEGLSGIGRVRLYGAPARRTPTVFFSVEGVPGREVYERLARRGVNAPAGNFYALEASRLLGLGDTGAVRAGLAPYVDDEDVQRLIDGVAEVAG
ncbi:MULTISPECIES: cysteine desulfurase-like protein [unclassified Streptomyces]|uniref:cysteine desulfurase-like protein n=1 Tax=unclassified Streptomyces TaxID=2593676 RepID=UPI000377BAC9|nr:MULTISPECIES: cysteine desulfurase-like protein [unclassified Streptomyces]MYX34882.1 cysteine desulfurase-like protein [Streptomyces sp. SID8377]